MPKDDEVPGWLSALIFVSVLVPLGVLASIPLTAMVMLLLMGR